MNLREWIEERSKWLALENAEEESLDRKIKRIENSFLELAGKVREETWDEVARRK